MSAVFRSLDAETPLTGYTKALLSERGRPRPPPSNRSINSQTEQRAAQLTTFNSKRASSSIDGSIQRGRPKTAALRQKSFVLSGRGASDRRLKDERPKAIKLMSEKAMSDEMKSL